MLGKLIVPKYLDPGSPLVNVHINKTLIHNTLIDLGVSINVMTKDTMLKLNLQGFLRDTPTVLQLADRSTVKPEGMLEDIIISIDSWEYPTDFLVLQTKSQFNGYPLILGRPWLATTDAYIGCREGNMTITDGLSQKKYCSLSSCPTFDNIKPSNMGRRRRRYDTNNFLSHLHNQHNFG
jgi:hypothetical protein